MQLLMRIKIDLKYIKTHPYRKKEIMQVEALITSISFNYSINMWKAWIKNDQAEAHSSYNTVRDNIKICRSSYNKEIRKYMERNN